MLADLTRGPTALASALLVLVVIRAYSDLGQWGPTQLMALSLGMTGGMLLAGGVVQSVCRRCSISLSLGDVAAAQWFLGVSIGVAAALAMTLVALGVMVAIGLQLISPPDGLALGLGFAALSAVWLLSAALSVLQRPAWLPIGMAAGLTTGILADRALLSLSDSHLALGTLAGFGTTIGVMVYGMRRGFADIGHRQPGPPFLPSSGYLVFEALPFLAYGSGYMLFTLFPHFLGWLGAFQTQRNWQMEAGSLEIGLILSLPPVVLVNGIAEYTLRLFWRHTKAAQAALPGNDPSRFGALLTRFYWTQAGWYLAVLAAISLIAFAAFRMGWDADLPAHWLEQYNLPVVHFTFQVSLVTYWLLGWGIFNCMFCVTLARPHEALLSILIGLFVMVVIGAPLGIRSHYSLSLLGFAAGTAAFGATSFVLTRRLLRAADYYYFAAF